MVSVVLYCVYGKIELVSLLTDYPTLWFVGLCTIGSQIAQTLGWGKGKTLLCANLQFSAIVFSVLLGWLFFDEIYDWESYMGIGLIFVTEIVATSLQRVADKKSCATSPAC